MQLFAGKQPARRRIGPALWPCEAGRFPRAPAGLSRRLLLSSREADVSPGMAFDALPARFFLQCEGGFPARARVSPAGTSREWTPSLHEPQEEPLTV